MSRLVLVVEVKEREEIGGVEILPFLDSEKVSKRIESIKKKDKELRLTAASPFPRKCVTKDCDEKCTATHDRSHAYICPSCATKNKEEAMKQFMAAKEQIRLSEDYRKDKLFRANVDEEFMVFEEKFFKSRSEKDLELMRWYGRRSRSVFSSIITQVEQIKAKLKENASVIAKKQTVLPKKEAKDILNRFKVYLQNFLEVYSRWRLTLNMEPLKTESDGWLSWIMHIWKTISSIAKVLFVGEIYQHDIGFWSGLKAFAVAHQEIWFILGGILLAAGFLVYLAVYDHSIAEKFRAGGGIIGGVAFGLMAVIGTTTPAGLVVGGCIAMGGVLGGVIGYGIGLELENRACRLYE